MSDILKARERAFEADFFHKQDAKLLAKMRERAALQEVAQALAEKLRIEDAELLKRVADLGLDRETGHAILLAPLVQVAWAEGEVTERERGVIFEIAAGRGVAPGSPAHVRLEAWLRQRPADTLFETALEVMKVAASVLPPEEREERVRGVVDACKRVAEASGGGLARLLGMGGAVSSDEAGVLEAITAQLRSAPRPRERTRSD
jgi:tellurite resistance protein